MMLCAANCVDILCENAVCVKKNTIVTRHVHVFMLRKDDVLVSTSYNPTSTKFCVFMCTCAGVYV